VKHVFAEQRSSGAERLISSDMAAVWYTQAKEWVEVVETCFGAPLSIEIVDDIAGVRASALFVDVGDILLCGAADPSGIHLDPDLSDPERFNGLKLLASAAIKEAKLRGLRGALIKQSVLCGGGVRRIDPVQVLALNEAGFTTVSRTFFCYDAEMKPLASHLSPRLRTHVNGASSRYAYREAQTADDLSEFLSILQEHARSKSQNMPFSVQTLESLRRSLGVVPLLYLDQGRTVGFSLSFQFGDASEIYAWGSIDPVATADHLTKYIVYSTASKLLESTQVVEFGCQFDANEFRGLTEFYRRFGGREVPALWAWAEASE
jgi:hypothetical protein